MQRIPRHLPLAVAAIAVLALVLLTARQLTAGDDDPVDARIPVGRVHGLAAGEGAVWAADFDRGVLARIQEDRITAEIEVGPRATNPAVGAGSVWVPSIGTKRLLRVDPATSEVVARVPGAFVDVAVDEDAVWAVTWEQPPPQLATWRGQALARIDPGTNRVVKTIPLDGIAIGIASGGGSIWVTSFDKDWIWRIDPSTNSVAERIDVGTPQARAVFAAGALWVSARDGWILRIDPRSGEVVARIEIGAGLTAEYLAAGEGSVWAAVYDADDGYAGTLIEIDSTRDEIVNRLPVGAGPQGLVVAMGSVWVGHYEAADVWRIAP